MPITEAMACGAPVVASSHRVAGRGRRRRRRPLRPREPGGDGGGDPRGARPPRRAARARARPRRRVLVAANRRALPRGVPAILVGIDTTPLRQTRAGTARYLRGLLAHLDVPVNETSFPATSRVRTVAADALWYPRLRVAGRRRAPLPDLPRAVLVARPARRHRPRPRRAAPPRVVQPLDAHLLAPGGAACDPRRLAGDRRLRVHRGRAARPARRPGGEDPSRAERRRGRLHARRAARRGRLRARRRDARAAQEPRPDRRGRRRRAARRRCARLGERRAARERHLARRGRRRRARRALPRRPLPRLRLALRGLRHPGRRSARLRLSRRHDRGKPDGGARRRRRRLRRSDRYGVDPRRDRARRSRPHRGAAPPGPMSPA